jgi:hypothetical protein
MNLRAAAILILLATLGLGGCASMSADECMVSDWHTIGYEDGARGYTADALGNRRKSCAKHGVAPDFEAYQAGREEGLKQYCQPGRGFSLGSSGATYNGVCPGYMEADFVDAYNAGQKLYNLEMRVSNTTNEINARKRELENAENRMRAAEAELISADTSIQDRVMVMAELKDLSERTGQLEAEIDQLIARRAKSEQRLARYQRVVADSGF